MERVQLFHKTGRWLRGLVPARGLVLATLWFALAGSLQANPSFLAPPQRVSALQIQLFLKNCSDTNWDYSVQTSSDLTNWMTDRTYPATGPGQLLVATAPATDSVCFYRVMMVPRVPIPLFGFAITAITNLNVNGKNFVVDSFDSSNTNYSSPTNLSGFTNAIWIYDPTKQKAGGDVVTDSALVGAIALGNGVINGHLHTGVGSTTGVLQFGPRGTVGDLSWSLSNSGIENDGTPTSWWLPDFAVVFPAVTVPAFSRAGLPAVTTTGTYAGFIVIPQGGVNNYSSASDPGKPLCITGPTTLWVKGSLALGVSIAPTNNASLTLYVGTTNGVGDILSLSGMGTMNQPGYARNLQIYGLPSLASVDMHGTVGWIATVYAPQADMMVGGGGNVIQDNTGAIVAKSVALKGHWKFHYDENLKSVGPVAP